MLSAIPPTIPFSDLPAFVWATIGALSRLQLAKVFPVGAVWTPRTARILRLALALNPGRKSGKRGRPPRFDLEGVRRFLKVWRDAAPDALMWVESLPEVVARLDQHKGTFAKQIASSRAKPAQLSSKFGLSPAAPLCLTRPLTASAETLAAALLAPYRRCPLQLQAAQ
jgi:hypothetical protein